MNEATMRGALAAAMMVTLACGSSTTPRSPRAVAPASAPTSPEAKSQLDDQHNIVIDPDKRRAVEAKILAAETARSNDEKAAAAQAAVSTCQADVDNGALAAAATCWNARLDALRDLDASSQDPRGVPGCLDEVNTIMQDTERCIVASERTDDDVLAKETCLAAYQQSDNTCGPLDLVKLRAAFETKVDVTTIQARIESKAAPIAARREKAAAEEAARQAKAQAAVDQEKKRCIGTSVIQVVLALRMGRDLSTASLKGCKYDVVIATVSTTTRDGWTIVHWGSDTVAAFKSRKRRADGSLLRTSARATYLGLGSFDRTDGGSSTVATFRLAE